MGDDLCHNIILMSLMSVFYLSLPLPPVQDVPEAATHDKEPRVSYPFSEKEERVSAIVGSSSESGVV